MDLKDLEIYQECCKLSNEAWDSYSRMDWRYKKVIGDQWITAVDSIGANIAEGFGRFHYLDKNKFNYNARGSLLESIHWTQLLYDRKIIASGEFKLIMGILDNLLPRLNAYIRGTRSQVNRKDND